MYVRGQLWHACLFTLPPLPPPPPPPKTKRQKGLNTYACENIK